LYVQAVSSVSLAPGTAEILLFTASTMAMCGALWWTFRNREKRATTEFAAFLLTLLLWNALQLAELLGGRATAYYATFAVRATRAFMTASWMYFTVTFAGYRHVLKRWPIRAVTAAGLVYLIVLTVIPSIATTITFTVAEFAVPSVVTYHTRGLTLYMAGARIVGYGFFGSGTFTLTYRLLYTGYAKRWQTIVFFIVTSGAILCDLALSFSLFPGLRGVDYAALWTAGVALTFIVTIYRSNLSEFIPTVRSSIVENIDDAVIVLNTKYQVVDYNSTAESFFTSPVTETVDAADVLPAPIVESSLLTMESTGRTTISVDSDGELVYYDMSVSRVNAADDVTGITIILRDVTEQEQRRAKLEEKRRELARKNERLEEFASIVSHDLRTPLSVARGNLELAVEADDSDRHDDIVDALDRMDEIISDTLALAREGDTVTETEPVDLRALVEDSWSNVAMDGATLSIEGGMTVAADRGRLRQVFENLFRNSVEHSDGAVSIVVGVTDGGIYVADDGPGIPADQHDEVFESGYSTSAQGTGFGLAIVQEIVEAHGWEISVTDSETGGTRFDITGLNAVEQSGE
jgi:signal transduction histidine kinase